MAVEKITALSDFLSMTLSPHSREQLNFNQGDEVDISFVDGMLSIRPLSDAEREIKLDKIVHGLMKRRGEVYKALASGAE